VDLSMVVDEAMVAGRAGRCDFRVGMRASGMGETRDSGRGNGRVKGWRMQIHGLGHAPWLTPPQPNFWGRQCGSWGGAGERIRVGLWHDGASISFHRVIS
jgi:hypothetical protein